MSKIKILWVDDEIDLLKPHILFLQNKGYEIVAVTSGNDAIEEVEKEYFNIIFLDEKMPGLSGLETLLIIKKKRPLLPVVMVTKSEDEFVMDDAIGSQISDYLIKPVNPNQLWLTVKKHVENRRLVSEKISSLYQQDFRELSMMLNDVRDFEGWKAVYKEIIRWELELQKTRDENMKEILLNQKSEANALFFKFIQSRYQSWIKDAETAPLMSNKLLLRKVLPLTGKGIPVYFIVIDNFRYDQWKSIESLILEHYNLVEDDLYCSILPTATNYARNSIFSGLMPLDIEKTYPDKWLFDEEKGSKNAYEDELMEDYLKRLRKPISFSYEKITTLDAGRKLAENIQNLTGDLKIIIYNFIDLLSHVRTEMEVIKELAEDETAYRSLTRSWFSHSPLFEIIRKVAETECYLVISTDHGSIRVKKPSKVIGDKNTTTNLRYKQGKNLNFDPKEVFFVKNPVDIMIPQPALSSSFIFAKEDFYFIYPNNYNYFVNFFNNTFQHGGVSMQEMLIPVITCKSKKAL